MGKQRSGAARRMGMKRHACKRARERWDINLTIEDIEGLNAVIRLGLGRPMERNSKKPGEKFFVTTLCGTQIPVVYDPRYRTIATVLACHAPEVKRAMAKRNKKSDSGSRDTRPPRSVAASLEDPGAEVSSGSATAPGNDLEARNG